MRQCPASLIMHIAYFDDKKIPDSAMGAGMRALVAYRKYTDSIVARRQVNVPESTLALPLDEQMVANVYDVAAQFKKVKHVILIGIGGSSLGVEAVHSVCATTDSPELHILDTVAAHEVEAVLQKLAKLKTAAGIVVCVASKSGKTTETLLNAEIVLDLLTEKFGTSIYKRTVFISESGSDLQKTAQKLGSFFVPVPKEVGGRFSIFTPTGLLPLVLLGHDIEKLLEGATDALRKEFEETVAESAVRLVWYLKAGFIDYNIFVFDTRLVRLGKWQRQLLAESLGKATTMSGERNHYALLPTVTTPVELHATGQLYFSTIVPVYTDFISFDDDSIDYKVPKQAQVATLLADKTMQDVSAAMYAGVVKAYQERRLPYRDTLFDVDRLYSLGQFMAMRMREVMYVAKLLDLNAFDQPNVELYKLRTATILGVKK